MVEEEQSLREESSNAQMSAIESELNGIKEMLRELIKGKALARKKDAIYKKEDQITQIIMPPIQWHNQWIQCQRCINRKAQKQALMTKSMSFNSQSQALVTN